MIILIMYLLLFLFIILIFCVYYSSRRHSENFYNSEYRPDCVNKNLDVSLEEIKNYSYKQIHNQVHCLNMVIGDTKTKVSKLKKLKQELESYSSNSKENYQLDKHVTQILNKLNERLEITKETEQFPQDVSTSKQMNSQENFSSASSKDLKSYLDKLIGNYEEELEKYNKKLEEINEFINLSDKNINNVVTLMIDKHKLKLTNVEHKASNLLVNSNKSCTDGYCSNNMQCLQTASYQSTSSSMNEADFRCFKRYSDLFYELLYNSYVEILDVDSLNINFSFSLIIRELGEGKEVCLVTSDLGIWELCISNNKFELRVKSKMGGVSESKTYKNLQVEEEEVFNIHIITTPSEIKCTISNMLDTKQEHHKFIFNDYNIITCEKNEDCRVTNKNNYTDTSLCVTDHGIKRICKFNKHHNIIFKKPIEKLKVIENFNGKLLLGNIKFHENNLELCNFTPVKDTNYVRCNSDCLNYDNCNKTQCQDKCANLSKCNYDSTINFSKNKEDCLLKCTENDFCSNQICADKCNNCGENCFWTKHHNNQISKDGKPLPPKIGVKSISYDGKKAILRWKFNNKFNDVKGFVSILFKTHRKKDGVILNKIKLFNCNRYCNFVIDGLEPDTSYTVGVRSYTESGLSDMSNLVRFKTIKAEINTSNLSTVKVSDFEVGNFKGHYCNV